MDTNMYQWPTDVTKYRTTRTDTIAMELHRLGCNVCSKLREEQAQATSPRSSNADAGGAASCPAHPAVHAFAPSRPPQCTHSTHSSQGFAPGAPPQPQPQAQPQPPPPAPAQFQQPTQPFGPLGALRVQADVANFYRMSQAPQTSPLPLRLPSLPSPTPTPPPPTPCSPLPPAGVLHCPTPQFAFAPPAPFQFRSMSPMRQQYQMAPEPQRQFQMATDQQRQFQTTPEQQRQLQMAQEQQRKFPMMPEQQPFMQFTQYKQPYDACPAEARRRRRHTHPKADQRGPRGDTPRHKSAPENPELLPGHLLWPTVSPSRAPGVREKVKGKGSVKNMAVPARASEPRRQDASRWRRRRARAAAKEPVCVDSDSSSSEFFWNSPDEEVSQRAREEAKRKADAENRSKHMPVPSVARRCAHAGVHRSREMKPRADEVCRSVRRHATGDKRRHERSDSLERYVKLRRAECDGLYAPEAQPSPSHAHAHAHAEAADAKPSDVSKAVLKGRVGKHAGGNAKRHRERAEMGDSPSRRHARETEKKAHAHHGATKRSPKQPDDGARRHPKQPDAEGGPDQPQAQQSGTFIELVEEPETPYFEEARETPIQVQMPDGWFNNLPTITEMKNEDSPATSRHVERTASTDSKRRVHVFEKHSKSKNLNVMEGENDLKTRKLSTNDDGLTVQENTAEISQFRNPPGTFSEVNNISPPLSWATGRNTEVYTAQVTTINKTEEKCVQSPSDSGNKIRNALLEKTWPQPLPIFLTPQNDTSTSPNSETALRTCANKDRLDKKHGEKDYERITIISIQHDKEKALKGTKQLIQSTKDDIQQSIKLAASDIVQKKPNESTRKMVSKSTQRGRSPGAEYVLGKHSRALGAHGERSRSGARLRRVQITPIVRFRRAPPVSLQNIAKVSDIDCKNNKTSNDDSYKLIKKIPLECKEIVSKPSNVPTGFSTTSMSFMGNAKVSKTSHHSINASSMVECAGIQSLIQSETPSKMLRSIGSQTSNETERDLSTTSVQPSLSVENKKHSKDNSEKGVPSSVTATFSAHATSNMDLQAMKDSRISKKSSLGVFSTNQISSHPKGSTCNLSDISWQTINVNSVTNSQESSIHSQSEFQKSSNPTSKCLQTFNENLLSTHGDKKRPSTGTVHNKKLKNAFSQSINTFPLVDSQTISLPYEAGLRESCVISSYNSPKHSLHGSQDLKKQQSEVLASKSKHSVANYQIVNNSSGTNQENINVLDVGLQNINETQNSEKNLRNMIIQNEIISQETEIKTFTLTSENENNVLIEKNVDATNQQIVENNLQISHEYHQESIADSHQETEVTQQRPESNNLDVQEAPSERIQNAQISPRRVRITLPPSSTLKGILKSHTNVPESQRKLSGSPRKSFMREPNFPSLRHIHHHSMTSSKDEDKFSSQKISLAEKHKHSKSFDIKTKDARVTIQEQSPPKRNFPKNKRNLSADKKKSNHSQVGASPSEKLPQKVNERTDQSFPITSDIKQSPNPVDADQNNQHSTTENGNAQTTRKSLEIQTDNLSKSTQLSAQSLQSNSQAASLQRLVKELTAVAKDLHRTVVHDLRRLENLPANTTASSEKKPIDSNKQNEVPNNTTVEHNESKEEKEIKCIFMSDGNATTNAPSPNALNGIEHKNKPPLDAVHIPQKEFVTETQICSKVQAAENKQPHSTLQNKFDNSRRTKDTETMRMKQHIVGNLKLNLPTFVDNKNKTRMTKITKPPRTVEEHTQKHLADRSRNQEHPGIVMKRVPKNELKDGEDLRKHHVVTMRDVHKSSASLSRRFQRRPVVLASHQRYNTKEVNTHQEVKLKNKKDSHLKTQAIPDSRPEVEITNVLLHSEPNPRPNQENHLPYSQHVRSLEATARCIPKTPSAQFKQLSVCDKEHGGSTSLSHLQINKEGSNSQRPSATVTQINQQSTRLSQQLMTQKPSDSMLIKPIISQNDTRKQTSELVCIKEPPKSGGKIQRKSSIFSKRIKNIVSNGLKRTRIHQAMRSKITSNVLNVSSEKDRKVLPRGTKSINQHSSSVPARRDRIQGPSVAQSRPQNSLQTSNLPKKSGAFTLRQQTELNVKTDKDSTNASSQKTEKYSSFLQNPKERVERGANRPTARVVRSVPIPNIPRQLLKRRGVVKKRRNINASNTTRRMENPTNRLKLNPVELAEIAELETALEIPPSMYSQPPPDGAIRNLRAPPLRPEAPRARKRFFNKRAANSSDSRTRHKSKPAATAATKARGGKTTVAAAANGVGKQPFSVIRRVKRPAKRRAKDHSEFAGVESSLSSRETMDSTTEISTVGHAVKPAEVPGENASDRAGREKRAFSKRTEGIVKRESKSSTRGSKSSWRSDSSGGSRRGSKRVTPCDSASSLPSRKPLLHKMRSALLGPLTCLKSHRQAQRSPPCEFLMRPIELSDKTSSKVLGIEGLTLNLV